MKLKSKLFFIYIPILMGGMASLGYWSYTQAFKIVKDQEFSLLAILTSQVVTSKIDDRFSLLARSGLQDVSSFETAYKSEVFDDLITLANNTSKDYHILDSRNGNLIFSTAQSQIPLVWIPQQSITQNDYTVTIGTYNTQNDQGLYASVLFMPWHWQVYVTESESALEAPLGNIAEVTTISTLIALVITIILIWAATQKMLISKILKLQHTASEIAKNNTFVPSQFNSTDELGRLAQDMEAMSLSIVTSLEKANLASRAKTEFLATMSHEIRTPLNGIVGMAKLLRESSLDTDQFALVNDLVKSANTLTSVINDVLDLSKIESGNIELECIQVDIHDLVYSVNVIFSMLAQENNTTLNCETIIPSDKIIFSDIVRIRQILINLVSNAVKFTQDGQVNVKVKLKNERPCKAGTRLFADLLMIVSDTGIGIPSDRLDAIFESFTQSDNSTTRRFGGSGLGLSIVKKLVDSMKGDISVVSTEGIGSSFKITLPIQIELKARQANQAHRAEEDAPETVDASILLVEDNDINAVIAKSFLSQHGHTVDHVVNGQEALDAVQRRDYDLILMDVHMPVMDGTTATEKIRLLPSPTGDTPIIGLTAEAFEDRHKAFIRSGMNSVITKPLDEDAMERQIQACLAQRPTRPREHQQ